MAVRVSDEWPIFRLCMISKKYDKTTSTNFHLILNIDLMKKLFFTLLFGCGLLWAQQLTAQRYLTETFTAASKTTAIYGANFTVLSISTTGHTAKQPLVMDVYQPAGDVETARPLIIYAHTGNFLPWVYPDGTSLNGACGGNRTDSATIEMCTRLAKLGYVVANIDYRLGWRPDLSDELQRRFTLINAAYRGVQDMRACVRYFRKSADIGGNPYKIDPNRIAIFGQGTGGYITDAVATLDKYSEIINTSEPGKFIINGLPMIIEAYNGDPYGVQAAPGVVDALYAGATGYPAGDTLYIQNHPGYSSEVKLAVNLGGALGDKAWIDANTPPMLSFHVPADPYAPCTDGTVIVPGFGYAVVNVTGSCGIQSILSAGGQNAVFANGGLLTDPLSVHARTINGGGEGFFPFLRPGNDSAPWEWNGFVPTYPSPPAPVAGIPLDCNTNAALGRSTIDTIFDYFAPRACRALGLECAGVSTAAKDLVNSGNFLVVAPNPASTVVEFSSDAEHTILAIELYDVKGQLVRSLKQINESRFVMQRNGLINGLYYAKVQFADGVSTRKVMFE